MAIGPAHKLAVWVLTPNGVKLAGRLEKKWPTMVRFYSTRITSQQPTADVKVFKRLARIAAEQFYQFDGHIFIMATGIVVRTIASLLSHKSKDPAVIVVDDRGRFAISLVSGHLGGANQLAHAVAHCLGAVPVITTATDIHNKPSIDMLAQDRGLKIENPECIKDVNMAILAENPIWLHDEDGWLEDLLPCAVPYALPPVGGSEVKGLSTLPGVWIGDRICEPEPHLLILHPPSLVAGIGCNRDTPIEEIRDFLFDTFEQNGLAPESLGAIATIDLKSDETGLCALASELDIPIHFYTRTELAEVGDIPTPSTMVAKHIGVSSVCEAAALLSSRDGRLIVPKQNTKNVTVAIARKAFTSSV
jgi:cobalt-precorrin 5A hydrolase